MLEHTEGIGRSRLAMATHDRDRSVLGGWNSRVGKGLARWTRAAVCVSSRLVPRSPDFPGKPSRGFFLFPLKPPWFPPHPPIAVKKPSSGELSKPLEAPPKPIGAAHTATSPFPCPDTPRGLEGRGGRSGERLPAAGRSPAHLPNRFTFCSRRAMIRPHGERLVLGYKDDLRGDGGGLLASSGDLFGVWANNRYSLGLAATTTSHHG